MTKLTKIITAGLIGTALFAAPLYTGVPETLAASLSGASLDADTVEYDMASGLITATGNVLMKQKDGSKVTGKRATYNHKTMAGLVEGNVIAVRGTMRMTCARFTTDGKGHMVATGDVRGTDQDKKFAGEQVDYYPNQKGRIVIERGGRVENADGIFTADHMDGYLDTDNYTGTGNAHLISPRRNIEAGGDRLNYYGKEKNGKVVLTGSAWAIQDDNIMHSNVLTVYLAKDGQAAVK